MRNVLLNHIISTVVWLHAGQKAFSWLGN